MMYSNAPAQHFLTALARLTENPRAQGDLFERLTKEWLLNAPPHQQLFKEVDLWRDWAARQNIDQTDTGIDLVARTYDDEYCAIQCKFFSPEHNLQKSDIDSFFTASGKTYSGVRFSQRKIVATTAKWSKHAETAIANQQINCTRLDFTAELSNANINWDAVRQILPWDDTEDKKIKYSSPQDELDIQEPEMAVNINFESLLGKILPIQRDGNISGKQLRPHQQQAVDDVIAGFQNADRGKLIMACGTGKTFTVLKIAEQLAPPNRNTGGNILFLVPSLALLSQTLHAWSADAMHPLRNFAVCSDTKVNKRSEDISVCDLAIPATTDSKKLAEQLKQSTSRTNVVFATYHSIDVVIKAQQQGAPDFDLIICDEAHRTTGVESDKKEQSYFTKVHDPEKLRGNKRLYMTATPRIYSPSAKVKAKEQDVEMFSMDDPEKYGEEFHRLDFSDAVGQNLLSDYKVLILAVDEAHVSKAMQTQFATNGELNLNDATKIIGCWNGLAKRIKNAEAGGITDTVPMRRAVAFTQTIAASKQVAAHFPAIIKEYAEQNPQEDALQCEVTHVDGTQNALIRNQALQWLKEEPQDNGCHILSNVRCLSEGVDVPALDAVMFLNPRKSQVDIVQSVGRVMRKAEGKDYGYIILPISIAADVSPEEALRNHDKYRVVWEVLQALRAHDNHFNAEINKIELNNNQSEKINVIGVGFDDDSDNQSDSTAGIKEQIQKDLFNLNEWRDAIYAKMVLKCGDRRYWETWATDVADIAARHTTRIKTLIGSSEANYRELFEEFLAELQQNLNPAVTEDDAIEMLSQHIITRPVFDALFGNADFVTKNPVSKTMQTMLELLDEQNLARESEGLEKFYDSVHQRAKGIDNAKGKQKIILELYDKFFKTAFPKMAERLGIVYTPVEIVDFIIHSVDELLHKEFGQGITAKDVHLLDPFTGTGTFITRLLQSGRIKDQDLARKYKQEIHANEIVLLAYYIAAINIEQVYHHLQANKNKQANYQSFEGIALTDTFQINERDDDILNKIFPVNSARVQRQKKTPIRVIVGNPPYSAGQRSANDANRNLKYKKLDEKINETYAKHSTATNLQNLYDSYIRAIRLASERIGDEGIVAFVTNSGYIDSVAMDGLRKCLYEEFNSIYCFNLRGNARTSGETRRKEKGNVFGKGTRTPVAILLMVKNSTPPPPPRKSLCHLLSRHR